MTRRTFVSKFWTGETVYHVMNADAIPGLIVSVCVSISGAVTYRVAWRGFREDEHREAELTREKPALDLSDIEAARDESASA